MTTRPDVLIVDDESANLELLERILRADFSVHKAHTGLEALRLLATLDVSVIIADHRMPEMNGAEFLKRSLEHRPSSKRLLLTAYADIEAICSAVNDGQISHFIQKPFDATALRATVIQLSKLQQLERQNGELLQELKSSNVQLEERKVWLSRSLNERETELFRALEDLAAKNAALEELALRDGLTRLYNHQSFQQRLREEVARTTRQGSSVSLLLCDVDHFKQYNDMFGHPVGDDVLKQIARVLDGTHEGSLAARRSDVVARYGGEEFAIILCDTNKAGAAIRAERLRQALEALPIETENHDGQGGGPPSRSRIANVTLSFGVAALPEDGRNAEELIRYADMALLQAKRAGRNCVKIWTFELTTDKPVLRSFQDARPQLHALFMRERVLVSMIIEAPDLSRLEDTHGQAAAQDANSRFLNAALAVVRALVPVAQTLIAVAAETGVIELFMCPNRDGEPSSAVPEIERICEECVRVLEVQMRKESHPSGINVTRVLGATAAQIFARSLSVDRQIDLLRSASRHNATAARARRHADEKLQLQRVIVDNRLRRLLQPIFRRDQSTPCGYEALTRGPEGSNVDSPLALLGIAEDAGLTTELDIAMLKTSLAPISLPAEPLLFVNVLPTTLLDSVFLRDELFEMIRGSGLPPDRIVLELSERVVIERPDAVLASLETLRSHGIHVALDDFGTKNANLTEIAEFRPEWVKLDRKLIRELQNDPVRRDLVRTVVDFGQRQGSRVLAEGVETREELDTLRELGIEYFQGFFLGRPAAKLVQ